ncbi:ABC transporter substrate-binding protein [Bacillaceae bacterium SIJ1]|uniref:ABC transporter substrate-binding protein n=1 Tax=Litoribacterium kuwaitense TaxID=1398745 RepID=UPI0013ECCEA5|nr:ABC transporter substrate-binding protein [Litoribacterium kuwaitense]NGP45249.1 ABC transporter substrate-binding protein [Litoribacterium kuwaitense]
MKLQNIVGLLVFTLLLAACGYPSSSEPMTEDGKTVVTFWHSMSGNNLNVLEDIITDYNSEQSEVIVKPVFQGTYREGFSKINSVIGTDDVPALMQLNEESTKPMIDMGEIKPMQDFIDQDNFNIENFEPAILGRYEVDGKLYSMPFNPSVAVVYYNKDAFKEVGLDPENPPHTYSEFAEAAELLTTKNGSEVERYGINIRNYGWHYEQLVVNQGGYTVNNENGRSGTPTEATIHNEEMKRAITWIKEMYDQGTFVNLGRNNDDVKESFFAGKVAMIVDTSSNAVPAIEDASFDLGIAKYPVADGVEPHGSVIGGASLWIFDDIPEETQHAAWDFVQYLLEPDTQVKWTTNTGYYPVSTDVYENELYKTHLENYPQVQATLDQLHLAEVSPVTQGAYIGVYPDIRIIIEDQVEKILEGSLTIDEALDQANDEVTEVLQQYQKIQESQ